MTKRILTLLLAVVLMASLCTIAGAETAPVQQEFYVSVNGSDSADGSQKAPFRTITRAKEAVRAVNQNMTGEIIVNVGEGTYEQEEELRFNPPDSGTNGYDVVWRGVRENPPTISGGRTISGKWKQEENGIWSVSVPEAEFIRDLFVNETATMQARSQKDVHGIKEYLAPDSYFKYADGFYAKKSQIGLYENPEDITLHWSLLWRDFVMHVHDIIQDPENEDQVIVIMKSHVWNTSHGLQKGADQKPQLDYSFVVENAYELLDEPGEFYFNKKTKILYYIPREGQDMNTAKATYAVLDKVLRVEGRDQNHHVKNIRFEDIRFAHATYSQMEEMHLLNQQGEVPFFLTTPGQTSPSSVNVHYATNIDFTSCVFFGMNSNALTFAEGVFDSNVEGCVFTDIGSSAFLFGRWYIRDGKSVVDPDPDLAANVFMRKGWVASYDWGGVDASSTISMLNPQMGDHWASDVSNEIWRNEPWAEEEGICSWVRLDLDDYYSIDHVRVSFETSSKGKDYWGRVIEGYDPTVSPEARSNFEILASNDKNFEEYEVLATVDEPAPDILKTAGTDKQYRYIMLRKTVPGPFAITGIKVYSYDIDPWGNGPSAAVRNCRFENNYIRRTGMIHTQAPGIVSHYPSYSSVSHNEIRETGYQGMCSGWGWADYDYDGCIMGNNKINHNRFEDVMMQTHDGGGIYTLGHQPDTEYVGNVISDSHHRYAGFYVDYTSSMFTIRDTVLFNVPTALHYWNTAEGATSYGPNFEEKKPNAVKMYNTWSDTLEINETNNTRYIVMEPIQQLDMADMPDEVAEIVAKSGLEDKWHYIYDRVPQIEYYAKKGPDIANSAPNYSTYFESPSAFGPEKLNTAKPLLSFADSFGELPWEYDVDQYYILRDAVSRYQGADGKVGRSEAHIMDEFSLDTITTDIYDSITHLDYADMVAMCDEALAAANAEKKIGGYPQEAIDTFKKALAEAKAMPTSNKVEKALAVHAMEKAYEAFYHARYSADIIYAYVPDSTTVVDKENKTVTLTVPRNTDLKTILPEFKVSVNAVLADDLTKLNYANGEVKISVYNTDIMQYDTWKLVVEKEEEKVVDTASVLSEDWASNNPNTVIPSVGGNITLQPWWNASMMQPMMDGTMSFSTEVLDPDPEKGIHYIFCAQSADIEPDGASEKNTYYEVVFKGYTAYLQRVNAGVVTELTKLENVDFRYGEKNNIKISVENQNGGDVIKVSLNGKTIFNHITFESIGTKGFFGVYSFYQKVVISD